MVFSLVYYFGPSVFGPSVASRACAGKHRLIPSDETALLPFGMENRTGKWFDRRDLNPAPP
jgi:hypothetical protein